jgi:hypothetical protein
MRFSEIANRVTGFSTPVFGIQWTPPRLDREVAERVIVFLEDRRVLYEAMEAAMPEYCVNSVLEIRAFLTPATRRWRYLGRAIGQSSRHASGVSKVHVVA